MAFNKLNIAGKEEKASKADSSKSDGNDKLSYEEIVKLAQGSGPVANRVSRRFSGRVAELLAAELVLPFEKGNGDEN